MVFLDPPDADRLLKPVRGDVPPVRKERNGEHRTRVVGLVVAVPGICLEELAVIHSPQPNPAIGPALTSSSPWGEKASTRLEYTGPDGPPLLSSRTRWPSVMLLSFTVGPP